jgi:hypothetical protein
MELGEISTRSSYGYAVVCGLRHGRLEKEFGRVVNKSWSCSEMVVLLVWRRLSLWYSVPMLVTHYFVALQQMSSGRVTSGSRFKAIQSNQRARVWTIRKCAEPARVCHPPPENGYGARGPCPDRLGCGLACVGYSERGAPKRDDSNDGNGQRGKPGNAARRKGRQPAPPYPRCRSTTTTSMPQCYSTVEHSKL